MAGPYVTSLSKAFTSVQDWARTDAFNASLSVSADSNANQTTSIDKTRDGGPRN
ncbi:MAG: hypothetical protein ACTS6G_04170 [Candidatus Hodgkinia cicadicola]